MRFVTGSIAEKIEEKRQTSEAFKAAWDDSREEYRLIGEMVSIRREEKMTQSKLAALTGTKQQGISRIEKHESMPSLRVFCNILDVLGYELKIVKKRAGV